MGDVDWVATKKDTNPRGDARGRRVPSGAGTADTACVLEGRAETQDPRVASEEERACTCGRPLCI